MGRARRRLPPGVAGERLRWAGVARAGDVPDAGRRLRALRFPRGVLAEPDRGRSRHHAAHRRFDRRAHHLGDRPLHLARALPDVAARARPAPTRASDATSRPTACAWSSTSSTSVGSPATRSTKSPTRCRAATSPRTGKCTSADSPRCRRRSPTSSSRSARANRAAPPTARCASRAWRRSRCRRRVGIADEEARYQGGAVAKVWFDPAKVMLLGEADVIRQQIKGSIGQTQFVSFAGLTYIPIRGLMATAAYERYQEDLRRQEHRSQRLRSRDQLLPLGAHRGHRARARAAQRRRLQRDVGYASIPLLPMTAGEIQSVRDRRRRVRDGDAERGLQPRAERGCQSDVRGRRAADLHVPLRPLPRVSRPSAIRPRRRRPRHASHHRALRRFRGHELRHRCGQPRCVEALLTRR